MSTSSHASLDSFLFLMDPCYIPRMKNLYFILTVLFEKHEEQYPQVPR